MQAQQALVSLRLVLRQRHKYIKGQYNGKIFNKHTKLRNN